MKKLICILLLLALGAGCALAEVGRPFTLWFDGEFSLELPEGWARYPVSSMDARAGIQYALGNETGERCLYIQRQKVDGIRNAEALQAAIEAREDCSKAQPLELPVAVELLVGDYVVEAFGFVRTCIKQGDWYRVGVQFTQLAPPDAAFLQELNRQRGR